MWLKNHVKTEQELMTTLLFARLPRCPHRESERLTSGIRPLSEITWHAQSWFSITAAITLKPERLG